MFRSDSSTPIYTLNAMTYFWKPTVFSFVDTWTTRVGYAYRVEASDPYGRVVGTSRSGVDDTNPAFSYTGSWQTQQNLDVATRHALGNTMRVTADNDASTEISFDGPSITILTEKTPSSGDMSISVDGGPAVVRSAAVPTGFQSQAEIFSTTGLASGPHTVTITKLSGTYMAIDGFKIAA